MDDQSRLPLIGIGILIVGLLVGYAIGRSGVRKARKKGRAQMATQVRETRAVTGKLEGCRKQLADKPTVAAELLGRERSRGVLHLTEAELALRTENVGIARDRVRKASDLLKALTTSVSKTVAAQLQVLANRLEKLRESTLRLDPRESDIIWRVRYGDGEDDWFFVFILMELQSTVQRFMALRLWGYMHHLAEVILKDFGKGISHIHTGPAPHSQSFQVFRPHNSTCTAAPQSPTLVDETGIRHKIFTRWADTGNPGIRANIGQDKILGIRGILSPQMRCVFEFNPAVILHKYINRLGRFSLDDNHIITGPFQHVAKTAARNRKGIETGLR